MVNIKLIVTGDMEKLALHKSLQKCFPNRRNGVEVKWETPRKMSGATSHVLVKNAPPSKPMQALATALIAEACHGKYGRPPDLVIVIDDVELGNLHQEDIVAAHFREAVRLELNKYNHDPTLQNHYKTQVQTKCSYHLIKPMIESYLFGDANALALAGVPNGKIPKLVHPSDVEEFETNDQNWLPSCRVENLRKAALGTSWWRHECHPKHYLEHLTSFNKISYDETEFGRQALEALNWHAVPSYPTDFPIMRSLFEDIALWFGIPNPVGNGLVHPSFYPAATILRKNLVLRNM